MFFSRDRLTLEVAVDVTWPGHRGRAGPMVQLFERTDSYMIDVSNGFSRRAPHVFHVVIGGQRRPFAPGLTGIDPELGVITPRRLGTASVHGRRAAVLQEAPHPKGGIHGGHVVIL